ncbi:MAG: branched-chain amino acid ABC transporter permease, partial [Betaproteobacteria bacterium]|nr:branched-chain amino acid ABC transporter permease [Betaproteobacteria bacterium]
IIFALSYNMLLGQAGMLSFGHAVYSGLGAFCAVHALNYAGRAGLWLPLPLLPLVGGFAGLVFGALFGYVTTRRAGTTFALISLGIGEMVFACVLMFPGFFGGEGGISTDRTAATPFFGLKFGPAIQVYYLVAAWCLACMAAMYRLTQTPLGRMANAVRDNPERAEFVGYNTQRVRFLQLVLSAFFAGVSGALSCINFEIVSAENVSAIRSGGVLLATFIGGVPFFFGPIIGAVVFVFFIAALSGFTQAWLLYLGLFFVLMVLYAPGGIASLGVMLVHAIRSGRGRELALPCAAAIAAGVVALAGLVGIVEMVYRLSEPGASSDIVLYGLNLNVRSAPPWLGFAVVFAAGLAVLRPASMRVGERWGAIAAAAKEGAA